MNKQYLYRMKVARNLASITQQFSEQEKLSSDLIKKLGLVDQDLLGKEDRIITIEELLEIRAIG